MLLCSSVDTTITCRSKPALHWFQSIRSVQWLDAAIFWCLQTPEHRPLKWLGVLYSAGLHKEVWFDVYAGWTTSIKLIWFSSLFCTLVSLNRAFGLSSQLCLKHFTMFNSTNETLNQQQSLLIGADMNDDDENWHAEITQVFLQTTRAASVHISVIMWRVYKWKHIKVWGRNIFTCFWQKCLLLLWHIIAILF